MLTSLARVDGSTRAQRTFFFPLDCAFPSNGHERDRNQQGDPTEIVYAENRIEIDHISIMLSSDSKRGDDDDQDERIMELEEMDRFDDYGEVADSKYSQLGRRLSNHLQPGMELDLGGCSEKGGEKKKMNTGAQEDR